MSDDPDIVAVLRDGTEGAGWSCDFAEEHDALSRAADEIERLRVELRRIQRCSETRRLPRSGMYPKEGSSRDGETR